MLWVESIKSLADYCIVSATRTKYILSGAAREIIFHDIFHKAETNEYGLFISHLLSPVSFLTRRE